MISIFFYINKHLKYLFPRKSPLSGDYAPPLFYVIKQALILIMKQKSKTVLKHKKVSHFFELAIYH